LSAKVKHFNLSLLYWKTDIYIVNLILNCKLQFN
jgi:hypothetical protein